MKGLKGYLPLQKSASPIIITSHINTTPQGKKLNISLTNDNNGLVVMKTPSSAHHMVAKRRVSTRSLHKIKQETPVKENQPPQKHRRDEQERENIDIKTVKKADCLNAESEKNGLATPVTRGKKRTLEESNATNLQYIKNIEPAHKRFQHLLNSPKITAPPNTPCSSSLSSPLQVSHSKIESVVSAVVQQQQNKDEEKIYDPKENLYGGLTPRNTPATTPQTFRTVTPLIHAITQKRLTTPAYKKYQHLVEDVPSKQPNTLLPLPESYSTLEKMFHALETCIMFSKGRDQVAVFHRLKKAVENICNKTFELKHLGQIMTVMPGAYKLKSMRVQFQGELVESLAMELPSMETAVKAIQEEATAMHQFALKRRLDFHTAMENIVKEQHTLFLADQKRNTVVYPNRNQILFAWDKGFDLENVKDIEVAKLPSLKDSVTSGSSAYSSASRRSLVKSTAHLDKDLVISNRLVVNTSSSPDHTKNGHVVCDDKETSSKESKKTVSKSQSLLERIRAKEEQTRESNKLQQTFSAKEKKLLAMLGRMSDVIMSLTMFYVTSKKQVMPMNEVVVHLVKSHPVPLSTQDATAYVEYLNELAPEWLEIVHDAKILINLNHKQVKASQVMEKVQQARDKIKKRGISQY